MPKYLIKASYTVEGTRGLLKEGGTSRRAAVQKAVEGAGGKLEAFYFAFGDTDVYTICDFADSLNALSISLAINASGATRLSVTPLITPEEVDAAIKKPATYRAPGS